jgi:hypothetical protein
LGGPPGIKAGAEAGGKIGRQLGRALGRAAQAAGQGIERAGAGLRKGGAQATRMGRMLRAKQVLARKAKGLKGRMVQAAATGSDWPYILAIIVCAIDDLIDMADISLFLGLDQLLDFILLLILAATKVFIRSQPGWWQIRIGIFIAELIPVVGILPLWTIASIYSWQKAKRMRQQQQTQ